MPAPVAARRVRAHSNPLLFLSLLAVIVWLPWAFGNNRAWAWAITEVWVYLLTAGVLISRIRTGGLHCSRREQKLFTLCLAWLTLLGIQVVPLPISVVQLVSPNAVMARIGDVAVGDVAQWMPLSLDPHATVAFSLKALSYCLLFFLVVELVDSRARLRWLVSCMVIVALFEALFAILALLTQLDTGPFGIEMKHNVAHGTFANRNHLAGYLEMSLALGIGLLIADLESRTNLSWRQHVRNLLALLFSRKMRLRFYLAMMVIALVLTRSRMGNVAFFASLFIVGCLALSTPRFASRPTMLLLGSLVIIDLCLLGTWFGVEEVVDRVVQTSASLDYRDEVNRYALRYWQDYFWVGSGGGTFYAVFPSYRQSDVGLFYDYAHNDYLQLAAEMGVMGLLCIGSIVCLCLWSGFRAMASRRDPLMRGVAFGALMGICALLIHSTVDFNLQIPANASTFAILLALGWSVRELDRHA